MNQKIVICNRFLNLCRESLVELEVIELMTGNELRNSINAKDEENAKVFVKLNRECKAMIVE